MSYDTSEFAVESIRQWWVMFGRNNYPNAKGLMICADGGGSNGSRNKGWKFHLQEDIAKLHIEYHSLHPKWNYSISQKGEGD